MMTTKGEHDVSAKLDDTDTYIVSGNVQIVERFFDLPLDYSNPKAERIRVFARSAIPLDKGQTPEDGKERPICIYFPDGPSYDYPAPLPTSYPATQAFFDKGYQMLFLDQRGTGLSTPLSWSALQKATLKGEKLETNEEKAEYASFFRGDSIVKDAEEIRKLLLGAQENEENRKWTICGNAYSGFLIMVYLSFYPGSVNHAYITGGIPPLLSNPDQIYKFVYEKAKERNALFYEKYPKDVSRVREILRFITKDGRRGIPIPGGGILSADRFLSSSIGIRMPGGTEGLHDLILRGSNDLKLFGELSYKFVQQLRALQGFDKNLIHTVLHQAVYCQGQASIWSADRLAADQRFSWAKMSTMEEGPVYFTGEIIYPSFWDDFHELKDLKPLIELLASKKDWPPMYDVAQLAKNKVPLMVAVYIHDMYVSYDVAQAISKVKNARPFITNILYHDSTSREPDDILPKLFKLAIGEEE